MDPDQTLEEIRSLCLEAHATGHSSKSTACSLAAAFEALDDWLRGGGFLPGDWTVAR